MELSIILSTLGTVTTVVASITSLAYWLGRKFAEIDAKFRLIDERFKQIEEKFGQIDERFKQIDERFKQIDERFDQIDRRFEQIEERLKQIDERFSKLENYVDKRFEELKNYVDEEFNKLKDYVDERVSELRSYVDSKFCELKSYVDERFSQFDKKFEEFRDYVESKFASLDERLEHIEKVLNRHEQEIKSLRDDIKRVHTSNISLTQSLFSLLVDFMSVKGLFTKDEKEFLVRDIERVSRRYAMLANPLKPEEARFILEVMQEIRTKDPREIDLSKLDKIIEIAKRWFLEDANPDALRLMFDAYMLKAILRKERGEL